MSKDTKILGEIRYLPAWPTCIPLKRRPSASSVLHKTTLKIAGCWRRCTSKIRIEGIQHPDKEYKFAPSCVFCCTPARRFCFACNWTVCTATRLDSITSHSPFFVLPANKVTCVYYLSYSSASCPAPAHKTARRLQGKGRESVFDLSCFPNLNPPINPRNS
jgi:hypothetical protein